MNWIGLIVFVAAVVLMLLLRRVGQVSAKQARVLLGNGAAVVDVRTAGEFAGGHLKKAINIPLDDIDSAAPLRFPNHDKAILLHCHSGMRSGVARRKLRALGYENAFNLGSYARAMQIVEGKD